MKLLKRFAFEHDAADASAIAHGGLPLRQCRHRSRKCPD